MYTNDQEQQTPAKQVTIRDVVAVIFRRKWIIIGVFIVTTGVTAGFILSQPTYWESTGELRIKRGIQDNLLTSYRRTLPWEEELATEIETAKSPIVISEARGILQKNREARGLETLPIDPGRVEVAVKSESNIIAISYRDLVPEVCTEVTEALLWAFISFREQTYRLPYPESFFVGEIQKAKEELDTAQKERQAILDRFGIVDVSQQSITLLADRSRARSTFSELERKQTEMDQQLWLMQDYKKHPEQYPDVPFMGSEFSSNDLVIAKIKRELVAKQMRYAELSRVYQPGTQELIRLDQEIGQLAGLLDEEIEDRIRLAEMETNTHRLKLDLASAEQHRVEDRLSEMPFYESTIAELDRRIEALDDKYSELVQSASQAKINQATSQENTVVIIAPASAPYKKNTRDYVRIALAPIFSLIVGLGLAFFMDSLDTTVKNPRDAESSFDLPVLASLNEQKK